MRGKQFLPGEKDNDYIEQLLNTTDQLTIVVDREGIILGCNQLAQELLSSMGGSLVGKKVSNFLVLPPMLNEIFDNPEKSDYIKEFNSTYLFTLKSDEKISERFQITPLDDGYSLRYIISGSTSKVITSKQLEDVNQIISLIGEIPINGPEYSINFYDFARLLVPRFADWCIFHSLTPDQSLQRVSVVPEEILKKQSVYDWIENVLVNDETDGIPYVFAERSSVVIPEVNPMRRVADTGIRSFMIVPLVSNQQLIGTITFIYAGPDRQYSQSMRSLAEIIAANIVACIEKSRLLQEKDDLKHKLVQHQGEGSTELQDAIQHLRQSDELIQTIFRISNRLNATLDIDQILDTLAQEAIQLVNGESGFAGLRIGDGMTVKKYFFQGNEVPFEHVWVLGEGIPGWVLKFKVPYGTSYADNDPLLDKDLAINANIHSIICTPILDTVGEVIAYFDIRNKIDAEGFSINDQEMLLMLAPVASIAIQNALAYQQRLATVSELKKSALEYQELAASLESSREEERTLIARELHDQLGQALTAVKFDLSRLSDQLGHVDEALTQKTRDIIIQVNALINAVRQIATGLRPGMVEDLGLAASIEWQAQDFEKRSGIECNVYLPDDALELTDEQALVLYRIFQEALTNIIRYAEAKQVEVTISKTSDFVTMALSDDGKGINSDEITNSLSIGIMGMRERTKQLGGIFEIRGIPGEGTSLTVAIPIRKTG